MKLYLKKRLFRFIGDIKWSGITKPFWFTINASGYKLKGEDYRSLCKKIQPGDILIRRFEGYVDKWLIPGWFNHAGIYVGGKREQVVHATSDGVLREDILNFMRTDHLIVLRPPKKMITKALRKAKSTVGWAYDFDFDFLDHKQLSCTELVDYCYPEIITPSKRLWRTVIVADDIVDSSYLKVIWDSRERKGH